jgi:SAM-dependent methyltransferase
LNTAGFTVTSSGTVDLGIFGEELFARAKDPAARTMGYSSMTGFSLYAVAVKSEDMVAAEYGRATDSETNRTTRHQYGRTAAADAMANVDLDLQPVSVAAGFDHCSPTEQMPINPHQADQSSTRSGAYQARVTAQLDQYSETINIHELPAPLHYWNRTYLNPRLERVFGATQSAEIISQAWLGKEKITERSYSFASLGAGDCSIEMSVAQQLLGEGVNEFVIHAFELSRALLDRAWSSIQEQKLERRFRLIECDINDYEIQETYDGAMAHHSLHHFVKLERIFDNVKRMLRPNTAFAVWDMIGRNGHMRWPECLSIIEKFWSILPQDKRYNHQLQETWQEFVNFDCSHEGFEGIRAQDILPALLERFYPSHFVAVGGMIEVFLDRSFGHNFNPDDAWDRAFIDLIEHLNTRMIECGAIKPTLMYAVFTNEACDCKHVGHLTPEFCVRWPTDPQTHGEDDLVTGF